MTGALDGIRVVDLTSYIAGSYGAMMLADLGADVIKVEAIEGDSFRELPGFYGWNRGKRSIAVNVKDPDGRAIVHRLAREADVVMENMRPGVVERLGVDYETLRAINPRIIYATRDRLRLRRAVQGAPGLRSPAPGHGRRHEPAGPRRDPPVPAHRGHRLLLRLAQLPDGAGRAVRARAHRPRASACRPRCCRRCSRCSPGTWWPIRATRSSTARRPTYRLYQGSDGEWFFLAVGNQSFWVKLCKAVGREDLAQDPRFGSWFSRRDNADALMPLLEEALRLQARGGVGAHPDRAATSRPRRPSRCRSSCAIPRCSTTR